MATNKRVTQPKGKPEEAAALAVAFFDDLTAYEFACAIDEADGEIAALEREKARLAKKPGSATQLALIQQLLDRGISELALHEQAFERACAATARAVPDKAMLSGRVADRSTGRGIEGLLVQASVSGRTVARSLTDAVGQFHLALDPKAPAVIEVKSGTKTLHLDDKPTKSEPGKRVYREIKVEARGAGGGVKPSVTKGRAAQGREEA